MAARDPNSREFAVHNGFNVQVTPLWQGEDETVSLMDQINAACAGFDGTRPKIMLLHHTYVAADDDDPSQAAQELCRFYNYFGAGFRTKSQCGKG